MGPEAGRTSNKIPEPSVLLTCSGNHTQLTPRFTALAAPTHSAGCSRPRGWQACAPFRRGPSLPELISSGAEASSAHRDVQGSAVHAGSPQRGSGTCSGVWPAQQLRPAARPPSHLGEKLPKLLPEQECKLAKSKGSETSLPGSYHETCLLSMSSSAKWN